MKLPRVDVRPALMWRPDGRWRVLVLSGKSGCRGEICCGPVSRRVSVGSVTFALPQFFCSQLAYTTNVSYYYSTFVIKMLIYLLLCLVVWGSVYENMVDV